MGVRNLIRRSYRTKLRDGAPDLIFVNENRIGNY